MTMWSWERSCHKENKEADFKNWQAMIRLCTGFNWSVRQSWKLWCPFYPTQAFIDKEGKLVKTQPGFMDKEKILKNWKKCG